MLKALSNISCDYASLDAQKQPLEVFCRKDVLRNFAKFTGKHLCQSLWHRCFPVNFAKFVRALFFIEHLRWLLLPNDVPVTLNHPPAKENLKLKLINV